MVKAKKAHVQHHDSDDGDDDASISNSSSSYDSLSSQEAPQKASSSSSSRRRANANKTVHFQDEDDSTATGSSSDEDDDDDDNDSKQDRQEDNKSISDSENPDDDDDDEHIKESVPLGQRLQQANDDDEARQAAATRAARQRKQEAKQKALAALQKASKKGGVKPNATNEKRNKAKTSTSTSKHRPTEASSKRADFYHTQVRATLNERGIGVELGAHRYKPLDPRYATATTADADVNQQQASEQNYAFIKVLRQQEVAQLKKRIAARQVTGRQGQKKRRALGLTQEIGGNLAHDKARLQELQQIMAEEERQQMNRAAQRNVQRQVKELSQKAGKPVYLKRRQVKQLTQQARLEQVRERHGHKAVEKVVTKRRKRQKSRDSKRLARVGAQGTPWDEETS